MSSKAIRGLDLYLKWSKGEFCDPVYKYPTFVEAEVRWKYTSAFKHERKKKLKFGTLVRYASEDTPIEKDVQIAELVAKFNQECHYLMESDEIIVRHNGSHGFKKVANALNYYANRKAPFDIKTGMMTT